MKFILAHSSLSLAQHRSTNCPSGLPNDQESAKKRKWMGSNNSQHHLKVDPLVEISSKKHSGYFPDNSYAASFGNGRLGNQICNLASLYAIYKDFHVPCYISQYSYRLMSSTFLLDTYNGNDSGEFINVRDTRNVSVLGWVYISNSDLMQRRNEVISPYKHSWNIKIEPYVCDVKGALPYIKELRSTYLKFLPKVEKKAFYILKRLKQNMPKDVLLVSIHIRLTDISYHLRKLFKISPPPREYFEKAMNYISRKTSKPVVFIAFSDDTKNAKELLLIDKKSRRKIIFPVFGDKVYLPGIVMAILSNVDGSILTYST